jgi:hypothetical protein
MTDFSRAQGQRGANFDLPRICDTLSEAGFGKDFAIAGSAADREVVSRS